MSRLGSRAQHILFVIVTVLYWCSMYVYMPILSPYLEHVGIAYTMVGVVLGSYGFTQILLRLPTGIVSDRLRKRKPFVVLGLLCLSLSCVCFLVSEQLGWMLGGRILAGVGASSWVAFTVMYAGMHAKEQTSRAMGMISLLIAGGQLLGMSMSGLLVESFGWLSAFWAGAGIGLAGCLLALGLKEPGGLEDRKPMRLEDVLPVMKDRLLWKVSTLSILAHSVLFITMFGFTPSYALHLGASKLQLTLLVLAFMVPHAATAYYSGRSLAPRFGAWPVVLTGFVVSAVCSAATSVVPTFGLLVLTQAVNGCVQGLHFPLLLSLSIQHVAEEKRATAMGFYQATYAIGMFAGPFLAGALNDWGGLRSGFYFAGLVGLIAAYLTHRWFLSASVRSVKGPVPVQGKTETS
ncbi:MFS transporter [Paenibacillus sp. YYML68]|uniref:MFS transporter n=1 Tax=Paenibacillus sp. YYML68 TaxID=2909250 RepID=UPI002490FA31|nr:MFS transporter [Paenibacillus sp. YYML68]